QWEGALAGWLCAAPAGQAARGDPRHDLGAAEQRDTLVDTRGNAIVGLYLGGYVVGIAVLGIEEPAVAPLLRAIRGQAPDDRAATHFSGPQGRIAQPDDT